MQEQEMLSIPLTLTLEAWCTAMQFLRSSFMFVSVEMSSEWHQSALGSQGGFHSYLLSLSPELTHKPDGISMLLNALTDPAAF